LGVAAAKDSISLVGLTRSILPPKNFSSSGIPWALYFPGKADGVSGLAGPAGSAYLGR
jgi:hypothetical protein